MGMNTILVRTALYRMVGPEAHTLGPAPHGVLEMRFDAADPLSVVLEFNRPGEAGNPWKVSREAFTSAVRDNAKAHRIGDCHFWHSPDGTGLVITLCPPGDWSNSAEIQLYAAGHFCDEVDAVSSPLLEEALVSAAVDEAIAKLLRYES